ncbi:MAG: hypothetical protein WC326_06910 [Candidatus Delongbacteria bacterium]
MSPSSACRTALALWLGLGLPSLLPAGDELLLDSPRGPAFAAASRAWLLERDSSAPPAAWPLPRRDWRAAPATPVLHWLDQTRPLGTEPGPWLGVQLDSLRVALGLRLESRGWSLRQDSTGRLAESANGLDLELSWGTGGGAWLHVRDAGVSGATDWTTHPLFQDREIWRWSEIQTDGSLTHDEQRAGAVLEWPLGSGRARLALLRDHLRWGSGLLRTTILQGDRAPAWSQFLFQADWGPLRYTQTVGELFSGEADSLLARRDASGLVKLPWREKWLAAHRLDWTGRWGGLGISELLVLGDRRPGPGALLPTGLFWSEQHAAGDRDNVLLALDGRLRLPRQLPGAWDLHGELCVDDYSLSDLGGAAEGQRTAWLAGLSGCPLPVTEGRAMRLGPLTLPGISWLTAEWTQVRPYTYGHFYSVNRFDHGGQSLGATAQPNSRVLDWEWRHEAPGPRLRAGRLELAGVWILALRGSRLEHGANPLGENVGGDRLLPHREGLDAPEAPFLAGLREEDSWLRLGLEGAWRVEWRRRTLGSLVLGMGVATLEQRRAGVSEPKARALDWSLAWRSPL